MMRQRKITSSVWMLASLAGLSLGLAGCLEGVPTQALPETGIDPVADYSGPPPATQDVSAFKSALWDNLVADNRCGACHGTGGQEPTFVHQDDINIAYGEAIKVADLASPRDSRLVIRVEGGHHCWLESLSACGDTMTSYIERWAEGSETGGGGKEIELKPPPIRDPGTSKAFPEDSSLFGSTVHPLLTAHCAGCHTESSSTPQAPFFASDDVDSSYEAVVTSHKIDLDDPANSRLVVRLYPEFHNCWSDCQSNADEMQAAIQAFADQVEPSAVDPQWVTSKALRLGDGTVASGGDRYESNVIALFQFKTGSGSVAYDTSGVEPAMSLQLSGVEGVDYKWVSGWGLEFSGGRAQALTGTSRKLYDFIRSTGEYSIEAWVVPANVTQEGPARIISYSAGTEARNFTLGQTLYNYDFLNRSSTTDANGMPALSTPDDAEVLQATQQHVVLTFDPVEGRKIYVNGELASGPDPEAGSGIGDWSDNFAFVLGDEAGSAGDVGWAGKLRLVAVHSRALSPDQVRQNFEAGVGEKFFLLFNVSELIDMPESYVMFEVSQFDDYAYLFNRPTFISLDPEATPSASIPIRAIRIGINGKLAPVGQAYRLLDTQIDSGNYTPGGVVLSTLGTVIASEKGPEADEFFLVFEQLGSHVNVIAEPDPVPPGPPVDLDPAPEIGLRTFEEIHASMAAATGVARTQPDVAATWETVKQQLPTVEDIEGFVSSQQTGISQLAIEYCNALVEDTTLRAGFFPGFDFGLPAEQAFDTQAERDLVLQPLMDAVVGTGLLTQPDRDAVATELGSLIDRLTTCPGGCDSERTGTVVKATCAAALGSAMLTLQ